MASPQKERGFTPIAHEILEQLIKVRLSGTQFRIILAVMRYTYGFNRKKHELSDSYLAKAIGVSRHNLNRDIQPLFKMNIIIAITRGQANGTRSVLMFNKDYNTWNLPNPIAGIISHTTPSIEIDTIPSIHSDNKTSLISDTQEKKEIKKDTEKKEKESLSPNKTVTANKNDNADKTSYGTYGWVFLSDEEYKGLLSDYSADVVEHYIAIVDSRAQANKNKHGWTDFNLKIRQAIQQEWRDNTTKKSCIDKNYDIEF